MYNHSHTSIKGRNHDVAIVIIQDITCVADANSASAIVAVTKMPQGQCYKIEKSRSLSSICVYSHCNQTKDKIQIIFENIHISFDG